MVIKIYFLIIVFGSSLFAGYTQNISSTIEGSNSYDGGATAILKMESFITDRAYTVTVSKVDAGTFRTSGDILLKKSSPDSSASTLVSGRINAGEYSRRIVYNMNDSDSYPQTIYARYESDELDGWSWVGAITVSQHKPTKPIIDAPSSYEISKNATIKITSGTISDNSQVKVQCTGTNTYYDDSSPYISSFKDGGESNYVSMRFDKLGMQTIWCTSFDELGLASATTSTTIMIEGVSVDEPTPPVVTPPIVEDNVTVELVGDTAIGGLSYWFTPYRCFDSVAPSLELKIQNDTTDSANNRILDLEYYTSGGSQSCVDTEGDSHTLAFGTRWRAEGLEFGDLTSDEDRGIYKYKKVRVTVPSGKATEIRLAVITTLGKVMVKSLFIDENGEITTNKTTTYGLNGIEITDTNILAKIKLLIAELESIKLEVEALLSEARQKVVNSDDTLKKKFDAIKKRLDDAKKLLDDIKQAIDNSNEDKTTLKKEADKIKKAIDDIKKLIDGYKKNDDNSVTAIDDIKSAIDDVIGMMVSESSERVSSLGVDVPKGRSTISGAIDVTKLADTIYAVWMVDGGNWYGYSPDSDIRKKIKAKYRLIEGIIPPYKATIVWALEDTYITFENSYSVPNVTQSYGNGFSIHGTNNMTLSTDEIVCDNNNKSISGIFKVLGDEPSVFVPNREIENLENFTYIYSDDGYYVLCEEKQGGS